MSAKTTTAQKATTPARLIVSPGNSKMGLIPSVSLPPVKTCRVNAPCIKKCYACKLCRIYSTVRNSYENNLTLWENDPVEYFRQLSNQFRINRYFRVHVSGDIPNRDYFARLVQAAGETPGCEILLFTKQYEIVNECLKEWATESGEYFPLEILPENLHIIFSGWGDFQPVNPYGLPESQVIFKGQTPPDNWKICGGNCSECACRGVGCWELQPGETIAFYEH